VGRYVFNGLVVIGFILCSGAFFLTADAVGSEQREGTLGLLFLTRVSWFDVVLGKLSSNGIAGLLALTALLPLLMIPVLAGGVSGGEAFRKGVALLVTLFLSLCIGLYASASTEERFKALRRAWALVVFSSLLLPVCALPFYMAGGSRFPPALSPLALTVLASSPGFGNSAWFWIAAAGLVVVALLFIWRAGVRLRLSVRDEPARAAAPVARKESIAESANRWSRRRRYSSPEQWVTTRQRGLRTILWAGAIVGLLYLFAYRFLLMGWGPLVVPDFHGRSRAGCRRCC